MANESLNNPIPPAYSANVLESKLRGLLLLAGAVGFGLWANWVLLIDRHKDAWVLAPSKQWILATLPKPLVMASFAMLALGALGLFMALIFDKRMHAALGWLWRWVRANPVVMLAVLLVVLFSTIDVYELVYDPFEKKWGDGQQPLRKWMLREDMQSWLMLMSTLLGALAISAWAGNRQKFAYEAAGLRRGLKSKPAWLVTAIVAPLLMGGVMAGVALERIPHFSDSLTYLMQGRMIFDGHLTMPAPKHYDLWQHSLFFVVTDKIPAGAEELATQGAVFFGKYPIGWPLILGFFDAMDLGFLANAIMMSLTVIFTALAAREVAPWRVAVLAAFLLGISPWTWFHGANFASHASTALAITVFFWLFLRTLNREEKWAAIGAGFALGAAVLIRPFDAAAFAVVPAIVGLVMLFRRPNHWFVLGVLMSIGAVAGAAIYLYSNVQTTGSIASPYTLEDRWGNRDWDSHPLSLISRFVFQLAELNGRYPGWGVGSVTVAVMGAYVARVRQRPAGLWIMVASAAMFFSCASAFGFTNVWWGPRWLAPVTPILAILGAELVDAAMAAARRKDAHRWAGTAAGQLALCIALSGIFVGLFARYGGQFYRNRIEPPHLVSAAAHKQVVAMGLENVVVAMPPDKSALPAGMVHRPPLDARAGIAFMQVPFESNSVIYVRAVTGWPEKVAETFPGRAMYMVVPSDNESGFEIKQWPGKLEDSDR